MCVSVQMGMDLYSGPLVYVSMSPTMPHYLITIVLFAKARPHFILIPQEFLGCC